MILMVQQLKILDKSFFLVYISSKSHVIFSKVAITSVIVIGSAGNILFQDAVLMLVMSCTTTVQNLRHLDVHNCLKMTARIFFMIQASNQPLCRTRKHPQYLSPYSHTQSKSLPT